VAAVALTVAGLSGTVALRGASAASSSADARTGDQPSIWYINPYIPYPLFAVSQKLFQQAASKYGYKANVAGSTKINIPQQIQLINQAVASGAKGIIFCDLDPKTYKRTILAAQKKGVIMVTTSCVDSTSDYSVGTDNTKFGVTAAQAIAKGAGADAQVVVIEVGSVPNQVASYNAFAAYAKAHYPKMKVLTTELDGGDPAKTETFLSSLSQSYPTANAVWFLEGGTLPAVSQSLKQAGKKPGDIFVLGVDNVSTTLADIKSGWISATLAQCSFWATPFIGQLIMAKINGHGPKQQSFSIGLQPVAKAQLPYNGCPASYIPKLPTR
jgi:ABC-type sugar transport system substrate-binding protein